MAREIVFNFHGVGEPQRALEPGEAAFWISVDQFRDAVDAIRAAGRRGDTPIRVTFDDGNASDVEIAAPILAENDLTAEFFVLAGRLGRPGSLDDTGVRALADMGMAIGVHGADHLDWRKLDDAAAKRELIWARDRLSAVVDAPMTAAAIPFGAYDALVLKRLRRAGYERVYTSDGGPTRSDAWLRARTSIRSDMSRGDVEATLAGDASLARRLRRGVATFVKRNV